MMNPTAPFTYPIASTNSVDELLLQLRQRQSAASSSASSSSGPTPSSSTTTTSSTSGTMPASSLAQRGHHMMGPGFYDASFYPGHHFHQNAASTQTAGGSPFLAMGGYGGGYPGENPLMGMNGGFRMYGGAPGGSIGAMSSMGFSTASLSAEAAAHHRNALSRFRVQQGEGGSNPPAKRTRMESGMEELSSAVAAERKSNASLATGAATTVSAMGQISGVVPPASSTATRQEGIGAESGSFKPRRTALAKRQTCHICNKAFRFPNELRRHIEGVHEGIKFKCELCDKSFSTKCNLHKHVNAAHKGKVFECPVCHKTFTDPSNLRKHIKSIHEKVRYRCTLCDKMFTQNCHLRTHLKSFHERQRYTCSVCDKTFTRRDHLLGHQRTSGHDGPIGEPRVLDEDSASVGDSPVASSSLEDGGKDDSAESSGAPPPVAWEPAAPTEAAVDIPPKVVETAKSPITPAAKPALPTNDTAQVAA